MDEELAEEITYTLIGFSVSFEYFEQSIMINPFVNVITRSLYYSNEKHSNWFQFF